MDSKGRIWFHAQTMPDRPDTVRKVPGIPLRRSFRCRKEMVPRGIDNYDPKTGKFELIDLCLSAGHMAFGDDKDETLYFTDTPPSPKDGRDRLG